MIDLFFHRRSGLKRYFDRFSFYFNTTFFCFSLFNTNLMSFLRGFVLSFLFSFDDFLILFFKNICG